MPAGLSCGEGYTQYRLRVRNSLGPFAVSAWDQAQARMLVVDHEKALPHYNAIEWSFAICRPAIYQPLVGHSIHRFLTVNALDFHPIPFLACGIMNRTAALR